jgi:hypothetical protein
MLHQRVAESSSGQQRAVDGASRFLIAMAALGCLVACDRTAERLKSEARAKVKAASPITPRTVQVGQHQLLVIDVPSVELGIFIENQRCYVWRDAEFRVSSMSCPHQPSTAGDSGDAGDAGDVGDYEPRGRR